MSCKLKNFVRTSSRCKNKSRLDNSNNSLNKSRTSNIFINSYHHQLHCSVCSRSSQSEAIATSQTTGKLRLTGDRVVCQPCMKVPQISSSSTVRDSNNVPVISKNRCRTRSRPCLSAKTSTTSFRNPIIPSDPTRGTVDQALCSTIKVSEDMLITQT